MVSAVARNTVTRREIQTMAHCNRIFHQLLRLVDRHDSRKIEEDRFHRARKCRTLSRWGQLVVMMFAQMTGRSSLRDIVPRMKSGFELHVAKLYRLGVGPVQADHPRRRQQQAPRRVL